MQNVFKCGLFVCTVIIIVQLFPSHDAFHYKYEVGRPWMHEQVVAPFDFPVYKSDEQLAHDRAELLRDFVPYYRMDTAKASMQYERFVADFQRRNGYQPMQKKMVRQRLGEVYARGVMASEDREALRQQGVERVYCIYPDRMTRSMPVDGFLTPKEAYEELLNTDVATDRNVLASYNLSEYVVENVSRDTVASSTAEAELLGSLSLTMGVVQAGERIIDRGEIVTPEIGTVLASLKMQYDDQAGDSKPQLVAGTTGRVVLVLSFMMLLFAYFYVFRPRIYDSYGNLLLVLLLLLIVVALASLTVRFQSGMISYYMVPYALIPIIIRVFFDSRTALFVHMVASIIISFMVADPFLFLMLQVAVGMLAVTSLSDLAQRSQLAQTALYVFITYTVMYVAYGLMAEGGLGRIDWVVLVYFAISSMFLLFAYILIYLFEKIFGLISSVTLVELTNINSELMLRFAETAPGTFQHSLQVSNIATEAAKKIGANSLLVRTGALYHDIGKMKTPGFFTENQLGGKNPLMEKDYEEAARIIIDHVPNGIQMAKKYHLPEQIISFISTHHGQSKAKYFYNSFINAHPGVKPNEAAFTYPGPLPNSKETAILMMADAVEARSRSLKEYTEKAIADMVEDMIDSQIADGQFKDAPITFQDVEAVKAVFTEKLINIYHTRIAYPKANNAAANSPRSPQSPLNFPKGEASDSAGAVVEDKTEKV